MKRPKIGWVGGKYPYIFLEDYTFVTSVGIWTVPKGFRYDGSSVPRIPFIYALLGNTGQEASGLHDWQYRGRKVGRLISDKSFLEVMTLFDNPKGKFRRNLKYAGVRLFSWIFYYILNTKDID